MFLRLWILNYICNFKNAFTNHVLESSFNTAPTPGPRYFTWNTSSNNNLPNIDKDNYDNFVHRSLQEKLIERWTSLRGRTHQDCVRVYLAVAHKWQFCGAKLFLTKVCTLFDLYIADRLLEEIVELKTLIRETC